MTRTFLFSCFYSILAFLTLPAGARSGGVVDGGGGGNFHYHTREEVIEAIEEVWADMVSVKPGNPVGLAYSYARETDPARGGDPKVAEIISKIVSHENWQPGKDVNFATDEIKQNTTYIRNQKIRREEDGYCAAQDERKYLGAVDRLDRRGRICISVYGLMRLPSGSLKADLMGLLIHEAAHLNGYNEEDARHIQRYFLKHYRFIVRQAGEYARFNRKTNLYTSATSYWATVIRYEPLTEQYVKSLYRLAHRFKPFVPPPELHDDLGEKHPELRKEVSTSRTELVSDIEDFARDLEDELASNQTRVLPRHLRRMGKLAKQMVDFEILHHHWLFGEHEFSNIFSTKRSRQQMEDDLYEIDAAVEEKLLNDADARPALICDHRDSPSTMQEQVAFDMDPFPQPCRDDDHVEVEPELPEPSPEPENPSSTQFIIPETELFKSKP